MDVSRHPLFFIDRSLGRHQVPTLLRADDWNVVTLAEHYGVPADERVADTEWLGLAGSGGWPVLMKDDRIRYRPAERAALIRHNVCAFCVTVGNLRAAEMAQLLIAERESIWDLAREPGPALYAVTRSGLRVVGLDQ